MTKSQQKKVGKAHVEISSAAYAVASAFDDARRENLLRETEGKAETYRLRHSGIKVMLKALGEDPEREGLQETPRRVIKAWDELCRGYQMKPADFVTEFSSERYDEMVMVGPVRFFSMCEHHLLPFFGDAWVAYIPSKTILGLSKIPRIVEMYSRRLQNQERMTVQIAETMKTLTHARGAACLVRGQHFCMMARGVKQEAPHMTTSALRGVFRTQPTTRAEFLSLAGERR